MTKGKGRLRRARGNLLRLQDRNRLSNARTRAQERFAYDRKEYDGSDESPEE